MTKAVGCGVGEPHRTAKIERSLAQQRGADPGRPPQHQAIIPPPLPLVLDAPAPKGRSGAQGSRLQGFGFRVPPGGAWSWSCASWLQPRRQVLWQACSAQRRNWRCLLCQAVDVFGNAANTSDSLLWIKERLTKRMKGHATCCGREGSDANEGVSEEVCDFALSHAAADGPYRAPKQYYAPLPARHLRFRCLNKTVRLLDISQLYFAERARQS